jgi:hypothetical protein
MLGRGRPPRLPPRFVVVNLRRLGRAASRFEVPPYWDKRLGLVMVRARGIHSE